VGELPDPTPGSGEVVIEVRAAALNHLDLWTLGGLPGLELEMPHVGGSDIAGLVAAVGENVEGWEPGARVVVNPGVWCGRDDCEACSAGNHPLCRRYGILGEHMPGGFAERAVVPARNLYPLPEDTAFESAAAAALVFQTAWRALMTRAGLRAGETVLITGASGGVSTAAIQIAKRAGARVFAVTSGGKNVDRVRELGADVVIDRLREEFGTRIWEDTAKRGVDVVLDSVGEATFESCVRSLAPLGRMVVYGGTTGWNGSFDIRRMFWRQTAIMGTTMATREEFERVMALVVAGELQPVVDRVWPLERAREAYEALRDGDVFGKLVLTP
jgi:NADPH:quinone reductase-like Zn-dependent oxidoreductase